MIHLDDKIAASAELEQNRKEPDNCPSSVEGRPPPEPPRRPTQRSERNKFINLDVVKILFKGHGYVDVIWNEFPYLEWLRRAIIKMHKIVYGILLT